MSCQIVSLWYDREEFVCTNTGTINSPYKVKGKDTTISPRERKKKMLLKCGNWNTI